MDFFKDMYGPRNFFLADPRAPHDERISAEHVHINNLYATFEFAEWFACIGRAKAGPAERVTQLRP
jgi:hypothetical protein